MSTKHDRASGIIQAVVAQYIQTHANTDPLITTTNIVVAPNFRQATVYVTTIPDDREDDALIFLKRHARDIRGAIKKNTQLKYLPHLEFAIDRGERHRQHIDTIHNQIEQ